MCQPRGPIFLSWDNKSGRVAMMFGAIGQAFDRSLDIGGCLSKSAFMHAGEGGVGRGLRTGGLRRRAGKPAVKEGRDVAVAGPCRVDCNDGSGWDFYPRAVEEQRTAQRAARHDDTACAGGKKGIRQPGCRLMRSFD